MRNIFVFVILFLAFTSCKVLKRGTTINPIDEIFKDTISNKLYIGANNGEFVKKKDIEKFLKIKINHKNEKLISGDTILITQKNANQNLIVSIYSKNLLQQNITKNQYWKAPLKKAITVENGKIYFHIRADEQITQTLNLKPIDFSKKHLVFIGNAKAEKFVKQSITGQPYLWGYQIGNFRKDDWVFMQLPHNVRTSNVENAWEKIYILQELLTNIDAVHLKMAIGLRKNEAKGDAKATLTDINLRIFSTKEDAIFYIQNIFKDK